MGGEGSYYSHNPLNRCDTLVCHLVPKFKMPVKAYSQTKRSHLNTQEACEAQGGRFLPVCEMSGAWAPEALEVLQLVCKAAASRTGTDHSALLNETLSRCAESIRKANARAHFKRHYE